MQNSLLDHLIVRPGSTVARSSNEPAQPFQAFLDEPFPVVGCAAVVADYRNGEDQGSSSRGNSGSVGRTSLGCVIGVSVVLVRVAGGSRTVGTVRRRRPTCPVSLRRC
jgi:hypothetical protein